MGNAANEPETLCRVRLYGGLQPRLQQRAAASNQGLKLDRRAGMRVRDGTEHNINLLKN